jgi:hypothetical protein
MSKIEHLLGLSLWLGFMGLTASTMPREVNSELIVQDDTKK